MASFHLLPTEILLRIFSYLPPYELLRVENVCHRFKSVIDEHVWSCLTCITKKTIGFPNEDFYSNLIVIARRVRQVREFVTGIRPIYSRRHPGIVLKLKNAIWELLRKLTPDAVFSPELVEDVLTLNDLLHPRGPNQLTQIRQARAAAAKMLRELKVSRFGTVRVDRLAVHAFLSDVECHPFQIYYQEWEFPLSIDVSHFEKLSVDLLVARISSVNWESSQSALRLFNWISTFSRLRTIEIRSVCLYLPSPVSYSDPLIEMNFHFHPYTFRIGIENFKTLLQALAEATDVNRSKEIVKLFRQWKTSKCVRDADVGVYSGAFDHIKFLLNPGSDSLESAPRPSDAIGFILNHACPSLCTKLYLGVPSNATHDDSVVSLLLDRAKSSLLKQFRVSYLGELDGEVEPFTHGNPFEGTRRMQCLFDQLSRDLRQFKKLTVSFNTDRKCYLSCDFDRVMETSGPVSYLKEIYYHGPPCFPFMLRVAFQAPHLHEMTVCSDQFADQSGCLEWTKKLLNALHRCNSLRSFALRFHEDDSYEEWRGERRVRRRGPQRRAKKRDEQLLVGIEKQIDQVLSNHPQLDNFELSIHTLQYSFVLDREKAAKSQRSSTSGQWSQAVIRRYGGDGDRHRVLL